MPTTSRRTWAFLALASLFLAPPAGAAGAGSTPLAEAIKSGDLRAVRTLVQKGTNVNAPEPDGTTPLHWAAEYDQPDVVDVLIKAGAKANAANRYGATPLWQAVINGNPVIVSRLLTAGADANTRRAESGETALMMAARSGRPEVVRLLLAHGAKVNTQETVRKQTALMWASADKQAAIIKLLVEAGADVKLRSSSGLTALMFAVRAGDVESTRALLDAGADIRDTAPAIVRVTDFSGIDIGNPHPFEPEGTSLLVLAIINARFDVAALLLERGADPNVRDSHGYPLHVLAFLRRAENRGLSSIVPRTLPTTGLDSIGLAKLLLKHGADINRRIDWQEEGRIAIGNSSVRIPRDMALGAYSVSFVGATPFYIAAAMRDLPFMRFLAENGADAKIPTKQKITPLMVAAGIGLYVGEHPGTPAESFEAVKLAYELGNDPKAVADYSEHKFGAANWDGATALHGAMKAGSMDLIKWLIEKGVPLDGKTKAGRLALEMTDAGGIAAFEQAFDIAEFVRRTMVERGLEVPAGDPNALPENRRGASAR